MKDIQSLLGSDVFVFDEFREGDTKGIGKATILKPWELTLPEASEEEIPFVKNPVYETALDLIRNGHTALFSGPAGCGKSYNIKMATLAVGYGFYRINMNGHSTDESLIGQMRIKPDEETKQPVMYHATGILEKAMLHGLDDDGNVIGPPAVLVIDEIDAAPPETLFVLQRVLEPEKTLVIDIDGGREVKAHPGFIVMATANTIGTGDYLGGYVGTNQVNFATRDRFDYLVKVDYNYDTEKQILKKILIDELEMEKSEANDLIKYIQKLTKDIRKANEDGTISFPMSVRRLVAWARGIRVFGDPGKAFIYSILNYMEPDQQNSVRELFQRIFGYEPEKAPAS